jgi:acetylglutamate/LysW-gamma-L-alpha-aminoadipate kinase
MLLIKVGGSSAINWDYVAEDIAELSKKEKIIIIHGANTKRTEVAEKLGVKTRIITSPSGVQSVYTDAEFIDVFLMVYSGLMNKRIVATLQKKGVNAVGLSGIDGRLWQAKWKKDLYIKEGEKTKLLKGSLTGRVKEVNTHLLNLLLENNYTPVICPPAISEENEIVNTDNDGATAVMAGAMGVKKIVMLFSTPGMLKDANDESSLVHKISKEELANYLQYAQNRMKVKVISAQKAFELGVETIYWGSGKIKNPVKSALEGNGTVIS